MATIMANPCCLQSTRFTSTSKFQDGHYIRTVHAQKASSFQAVPGNSHFKLSIQRVNQLRLLGGHKYDCLRTCASDDSSTDITEADDDGSEVEMPSDSNLQEALEGTTGKGSGASDAVVEALEGKKVGASDAVVEALEGKRADSVAVENGASRAQA